MYRSTPNRILDTRSGKRALRYLQLACLAVLRGHGGYQRSSLQLRPAVTGNLTVSSPTAAGFLYLGPTAMTNPNSSALTLPRR